MFLIQLETATGVAPLAKSVLEVTINWKLDLAFSP